VDARAARRHVRRRIADFCEQQAEDPGQYGSAETRLAIVTAWRWAAVWLRPLGRETSDIPANLQPLVRPDGTLPDGTTADEWRNPADAAPSAPVAAEPAS
jgi:hypothetical protein